VVFHRQETEVDVFIDGNGSWCFYWRKRK